MISFMNFLEAQITTKSIIVQRIGQTPANVDQAGGYSAWFWDSEDGETPSGPLKISYPIERIEKIMRDKSNPDYIYINIYCAQNKTYTTRLPIQVVTSLEDNLERLAVTRQQQTGPQQVGQARMNQNRRVG